MASETYTITIDGVEDLAGNPVIVQATQFTTGAGPDLTGPVVVRTNPFSGATNVPVNTVITVEVNEPIDPFTVNNIFFIVRDNTTFENVSGGYSISSDGRLMSFVPDAPLAVNRGHSVFNLGVRDVSGNPVQFFSIFFTTDVVSDTVAPQVIGVSPTDGLTDVPINARVVVGFNEPIQSSSIDDVTLSMGGAPVNVIENFSNGNRTLTLVPVAPLEGLTTYTVGVDGVKDLSGNVLATPVTTTFTTEPGVDLFNPTVTLVDPASGAVGVPTNVKVQVRFSERINPLTVTETTFFVQPNFGAVHVPGSVTVATDGLSAAFTPGEALLPSTSHFVSLSGVADLSGQTLFFGFSFTTAGEADTVAPTVVSVSPPDGTSEVPVNARATALFSEPLSAVSVGTDAIMVSTNGTPVSGQTSLSNDRRSLTFTPIAPLDAAGTYTITIGPNITDRAGNSLTPFSSDFTTGGSDVADATRPSVASVSPVNGATDVPVDTAIRVTFNEIIDPTTVHQDSIRITIDGFSGQVGGNYAVNGAEATFTPLGPLPGGRRVRVTVDTNEVQDLAGNGTNFFQSSFDTAAVPDATPPEVALITPSDGATGVGLNAVVVLTFSEALDPTTVNGNNFTLFANGNRIFPGVSRSADNRTVMLNTTLPGDSLITVIVTDDVKDLAGNRLADFRSEFTTAPGFDTQPPFVLVQRPANGAFNVPVDIPSVVLYINEPLDAATVTGALFVSQNGALISGVTTVSSGGQAIEFVPAAPLENNAIIEIALKSTARDLAGHSLSNYQGQFRTVGDPDETTPFAVRISPPGFFSQAPLNVVIEVEFNEPLDPATVNTTNVSLEESDGGNVPINVSLDGDGRVVRLIPTAPLTANTNYFYFLNGGLRDLDGQAPTFTFTGFLMTGEQTDSDPPMVVAVSPPDQAQNVGVNASIRARFNERVNPLSVNGTTIAVVDGGQAIVPCTINFSNNDMDVQIVPHSPLMASETYTITIDGVEDLAGNPVIVQATQFTTGAGPDFANPFVVRTDPFSGATNVPVNVVISVEASEPIDPGTVNSSSFIVRDNTTFGNTPGSASVSSDGRFISFVPDAPLETSRSYSVFSSGAFPVGLIQDVSGNFLTSLSIFFTTGTATDTTAPQVVGVSPPDGFLNVPINARVVIGFDEPIQGTSVNGISLTNGGGPVNALRSFSDGNRALTLQPTTPLAELTTYTVTVDGVRDLSGNPLAMVETTIFTTGTGAELTNPTVVSVSPANGATGVATDTVVTITFSDPVNPLTVTDATFFVQTNTGVRVTGAITVAADGLIATITPDAALSASTNYQVRAFNPLTDLVGQGLSSFFSSFTTAAP
jgi:hypothetical protein